MNLKLLRGCLLEELGRVWHLTRGLTEILPETAHAIGMPGRHGQITGREASHLTIIQDLFDRFGAVVPDQPESVISGLFTEIHEELQRQSGVYPPAAMDFRLISGLNRIVHHKLAALRSGMVAAHLLEAREVEAELRHCLDESEETRKDLASLAAEVLHQCSAESPAELAGMPIHFD